jgi:hypothetical protein
MFIFSAYSDKECIKFTTLTKSIPILSFRAFNPDSQYFIPLFNKISLLCGQQPGGDEASNEGWNSGARGHDFTGNSTVLEINVSCS